VIAPERLPAALDVAAVIDDRFAVRLSDRGWPAGSQVDWIERTEWWPPPMDTALRHRPAGGGPGATSPNIYDADRTAAVCLASQL
jgi:hypothetical protein